MVMLGDCFFLLLNDDVGFLTIKIWGYCWWILVDYFMMLSNILGIVGIHELIPF